jgi:hypothetical protein
MRVEQEQKCVIGNSVAPGIEFVDSIARQDQAEPAILRIVPIFFGHFLAIAAKPAQILYCGPTDNATLKKMAPPH